MDGQSDGAGISKKLQLIAKVLEDTRVFSEMLKHLINASGVSPKVLATRLNVDASAISHWQKNRRLPSDTGTVFLISEALDLSAIQRQQLLFAWTIQNIQTSLVPYIETALAQGSRQSEVLIEVEAFLESVYKTLEPYERKDFDNQISA